MSLLWQAMEGSQVDAVRHASARIVSEGYPMSALLSQLHDDVVQRPSLTDIDKAIICEKIANVSFYFLISFLFLFCNLVFMYFK